MPTRTIKKFTVPLVGPYNTRFSAVNATDSTSGYIGTGIIGSMIIGKSTQSTDKDSRFINCFAQVVSDPISGKRRSYVVKRPGFATGTTPAAGEKGYAILVWTGQGTGTKVMSAFGATNSTLYDGTTSKGAITGQCTGITETTISGTATLAISSADNTGWYYPDAGALTEITSTNWPGDSLTVVGTFAHMDGFAFIMTSNARIYASDLNSITGWTANNYANVNVYPDKGIGCIRWKNYVMAFGPESVEFWRNAGATPFPLARVIEMTQKVGAVSATAISRIADTIFWCGTTPEGGMSIFQWNGQISRLSVPEIEAIMILAGASNISLTTIRFYGRSFVLVKAGPTTLAYCLEEKMWHEWQSTTPLWVKCTAVMTGGTVVNYAVSDVSTAGKVYVMNLASLVFTDDGTTYTARVQTADEDEGTNSTKFYSYLDILGDVESSASTLTISASDDDFATYDVLGTVDLSDQHRRITRLGSARSRSWVFTHAAATPMRLEHGEGLVEIGTD